MLEVSNLDAFYGKIQVLRNVFLHIDEGQIVALVGPNEAGKTTLLNVLSGLLPPSSGNMTFLGKRIDRLPPHSVVNLGICHIPEGRRLFANMSVRDNLEMGAYPRRARGEKDKTLDEVYRLFPRLKEREGQLARTLSGGERQMLALGRGLMSRPRLCAIDEPSNGLAPLIVAETFQIIRSLREQGITILLIEQNVKHTLEIADRAYVMENGQIVLEGDSRELIDNDHVRQAYLGL
ncbi:MAG: ABC transporter ATP-binding protein [Deltaproteobacteria bacterium]|nr:ABC transporter ATP-binding protein [Deltaproteobacteria bacterium]